MATGARFRVYKLESGSWSLLGYATGSQATLSDDSSSITFTAYTNGSLSEGQALLPLGGTIGIQVKGGSSTIADTSGNDHVALPIASNQFSVESPDTGAHNNNINYRFKWIVSDTISSMYLVPTQICRRYTSILTSQ